MNIQLWLKHTEKVLARNSPAILTAIGAVGVVSTAYFTGKATFKAADIIKAEQFKLNVASDTNPRKMENKEKLGLVWKLYIPATTSAFLTIGIMVCATRVGTRRAAAYAAAYTITERAYSEYKDKVVEKFGDKNEQAVRDELAVDRINRQPITQDTIITGSGEVMCHDAWSGRYFKSSMEALKRAQNDLNYKIISSGEDCATISDFYDLIGLAHTGDSDNMGWNTSRQLELGFSSVLLQEEHTPATPCISYEFVTVPIPDPGRFRGV